MKKKFTLIFLFSMFTAGVSFSQTVQQKIEAQAKDPKTAENAAKADVYISKNKNITEENTTDEKQVVATKSKKTSAGKSKKKRCKNN